MGNRHILTKCIALGTWDQPGPAHQSPVLSCKASFRHPAGIDVLIIEPGKNEIAFVVIKGILVFVLLRVSTLFKEINLLAF